MVKRPLNGALKSALLAADGSGMDLSAVAVQGLDQAQAQLESAAIALASAGTSPDGAGVDVVDLSSAMVAMMSAKTDFSASLGVLKTAGQIDKHLTDLMA